MCTDCLNDNNYELYNATPVSTDVRTDLRFRFKKEVGNVTNYGVLEVYRITSSSETIVCCYNIASATNFVGITVVGTNLRFGAPIANRVFEVKVTMYDNNKPELFVVKQGNNNYDIIGIDDVRGLDIPIFTFQLNGLGRGVNIRYDSSANQLIVQGGPKK